MEFLRVNGVAVPVSLEALSEIVKIIGKQERAFDGTLLSENRAAKREWSAETTLQTAPDAVLFESLIRGLGHVFPFDTDAFSTRGLGPKAGSVFNLRPGSGSGSGQDVAVQEFNFSQGVSPEPKYGSGSAALEIGRTNFYTSNQATATDTDEDTTGFSALATAVIASDVATFLQGLRALKITNSAADDGFTTDTLAVGDEDGFQVSIYVLSETATSVTLEVHDNAGLAETITEAIPANEWRRLEIAGNHNPGSSVQFIEVTTSGAGDVWYADMLFSNDGGPTFYAWRDGALTNGHIDLPLSVLGPASKGQYTFATWVRMDNLVSEAARTFFDAERTSDGRHTVSLTRLVSSQTLSLTTRDEDGVNDFLLAVTTWDATFKHVAVVIRENPAAGENKKEIYLDGVLASSSNPTKMPRLSQMTSDLIVGAAVGNVSTLTGGTIDDLAILPFAANAATVLAMFEMGKAMPPLPSVFVDGDFIEDEQLTVLAEGRAERSSRVVAVKDGALRNNLRSLAFNLKEI